jgi:hypothetical protein
MVKAIEQIRRDLHSVTEHVSTVQQNLETIYADYLETLGSSIERQLVLAAYELCTQVYPDTFLQLSYDQRQEMQQELRRLAQQIHHKLSRLLTEPMEPETEEEIIINKTILTTDDDVEQELLEVFESIDQVIGGNSQFDEDDEDEDLEEKLAEQQQRRSELSQLAERIADSIADMMNEVDEPEPIEEGSPDSLVEWYRTTEKQIRQVLSNGSRETNRLLQRSRMLPSHVPLQVLDLAVQDNRRGGSSPKPTNLVNLMIEADLGEKRKKRIRVTAVHLKLSEIEFGDTQVLSQRGRIREQLLKIKQLKKVYKKVKKDLAIAEAESAWRSSWHQGKL